MADAVGGALPDDDEPAVEWVMHGLARGHSWRQADAPRRRDGQVVEHLACRACGQQAVRLHRLDVDVVLLVALLALLLAVVDPGPVVRSWQVWGAY